MRSERTRPMSAALETLSLVKPLTLTEAENKEYDANHVGWVWRKDGGTARWVFTTSLTVRAYPASAQFIPVYYKWY